MASLRRGRLAVVVKRGGLPELSSLWEAAAREAATAHGVDAAPLDGGDPAERYHAIRRELEAFSRDLARKPEVVAINKVFALNATLGYRYNSEPGLGLKTTDTLFVTSITYRIE